MSTIQSSAVDIDTSLANVSTAINGYVNIAGDVRTTRDDYTIDMKRDKGLKKTMKSGEYAYLYRCTKSVHLHLTPLDASHTRMNYDLDIKKIGANEILFIVLAAIFAISAIPFFFLDHMAVIGGMFLLMAFVYSIFPILSICVLKSPKRVDKLFHNSFIKGLDSFCKIVAENEANRT